MHGHFYWGADGRPIAVFDKGFELLAHALDELPLDTVERADALLADLERVRSGALPKWADAGYTTAVEATADGVTISNDFTDPDHLKLSLDDFRDALRQVARPPRPPAGVTCDGGRAPAPQETRGASSPRQQRARLQLFSSRRVPLPRQHRRVRERGKQ